MPQADLARQHRDELFPQGAMRYLREESTGSSITTPAQSVTSLIWPLLVVGHAPGGQSATTGMYVLLDRLTSEADLHQAAVITPASVVDLARTVFSLNISDTADVFGVSRPTIYQWMKLGDIDLVRSSQYKERIKMVYRATQFWQKFRPLTGRWQQAILPSGACLFDLLKAEKIDLAALEEAYAFLDATGEKRRKEEGARAKKAVGALADAFANLAKEANARRGKP